MQTLLLSDEDVRRYSYDLSLRLLSLGPDFPSTWVTLGLSGDKMAEEIALRLDQPQRDSLRLIRTSFDRSSRTIQPREDEEWPIFGEPPILLIDSAVHSGASMNIAVDALYALGAMNIITYSLIVKRTSDFIPNYFGMLIGEHDRALFQLERLPNNRLQRQRPYGTLRAIRDSDVERQPSSLNCGVPSLDKISFSDLMYSVKTQNSVAMLYEVAGVVAGFIHFNIDDNRILHIDAIANDMEHRKKGIGAALMRWAETYARASKCYAIELWAIEERTRFYERLGFKAVTSQPWNLGHGERYLSMRKPILYNAKIAQLMEY